MTFSRNAFYFNKKKVIDFDIEKGIENTELAYRFRTEYDGPENEVKNMLLAFLSDPKLSEIDSFVIGHWGPEHDDNPAFIIQLLIDNKAKLQHIKGIFFGDISYEENEVSWIEHCDHGPLLAALPNLEFYQIRGGNGLALEELNHSNLKKLVIQTGGLSKSIYAQLSKATLPALEHLELWLGSENYGFNATPAEVAASYRGTGSTHLPSLKYLGLRNSEIANELAQLIKGDPILDRIEELDFSKGTIDDIGAEALVDNPAIKNLKKLDLHHNFISDEWAEKLNDLGIKVDLKEREPNADEYDRYVSVSE
ncbi:MAG: Unknown protein [uncultured Aureispira sp.]|uniref:Cytoplasmic protein n=1 Tax=uncultured Aureispira sp. TaxID=1331704 RepID=A0A6S6U5U0_9BACT|nr:MAG: Unknown protein [uncultured Aureispira sp.]